MMSQSKNKKEDNSKDIFGMNEKSKVMPKTLPCSNLIKIEEHQEEENNNIFDLQNVRVDDLLNQYDANEDEIPKDLDKNLSLVLPKDNLL